MGTRLITRHDTAANWTSNNPILAAGEFAWEFDNKNLKIGDGINTWKNLPYFTGTSSHFQFITSGSATLGNTNNNLQFNSLATYKFYKIIVGIENLSAPIPQDLYLNVSSNTPSSSDLNVFGTGSGTVRNDTISNSFHLVNTSNLSTWYEIFLGAQSLPANVRLNGFFFTGILYTSPSDAQNSNSSYIELLYLDPLVTITQISTLTFAIVSNTSSPPIVYTSTDVIKLHVLIYGSNFS